MNPCLLQMKIIKKLNVQQLYLFTSMRVFYHFIKKYETECIISL